MMTSLRNLIQQQRTEKVIQRVAPFGSFDLIYGGNVTKWLHFTNSLRLRLALRISKVDPARAKAEAEAAVAGGVMQTSPDEDAYIKKSLNGADNNGLSIMSDWNEFRMECRHGICNEWL